MNELQLAAKIGSFVNMIFAPHKVEDCASLLTRQGLSPEKLRQAVVNLLATAIKQGHLTEFDLKDEFQPE